MKQHLLPLLAFALTAPLAAAQPTSQQMSLDVEVSELLFLEQSHEFTICLPFFGCNTFDSSTAEGQASLELGRSVDLVGNVDWDAVDEASFRDNFVGLVRTKLRYGTNHANQKMITVESDIAPAWDTKVEVESLVELIDGITSVSLGTNQGAVALSTSPTAIIRDIQQAYGEARLLARVEADPTEVFGSQSLTLTYTITDQ